MRAAFVALALLATVGPAADARCVHRGCRQMTTTRSGVRSPAPMIAASLQAAAPLPPAPDAPPAATGPPAPAPAPARLGVVAREWSLTLSRTTLPAGAAVVELQNLGEDAHNLRVERVDGTGGPLDVPLAEAGERQSGETTLSAGDYKVYCALPGHDAQGMHARLTVSP
ncbi:MAG: hypothetical protein QOF55_719 [Thermoleophilaceae bacterium]|nr:hypothetical protein [Thermoleophilaceae bacterium]